MLVDERLAACVLVRSALEHVTVEQHGGTTRWNNTVERTTEWDLDVDATHACAESVTHRITALHPYELPAVIIRAVETSAVYAAWVAEHCH